MNKKVFISRNYRSQFDAAGKAKIDCEIILANKGWKNIGLKQTSYANGLVGTIISFVGVLVALFRMPFNGVVCLQYPTKKFYTMMLCITKLKGCKVITIVHDLRSLKARKHQGGSEINLLKHSNSLIVHNPKMKEWLQSQGITCPIQELNIFDYLGDCKKKTKDFDKYKLVYAGGLSKGKNAFLYDFGNVDHSEFSLNLYGKGFDPYELSPDQEFIDYKGFFPSDQVAEKIEGTFGLVWDGDSLEECSGRLGEYLRYNNPHKCSLYILSELPIIIWNQAAISDFIIKENIGIKISSLHDLNSVLKNLSKEDYLEMRQNVIRIKEKLSTGGFLTAALNAIENKPVELRSVEVLNSSKFHLNEE